MDRKRPSPGDTHFERMRVERVVALAPVTNVERTGERGRALLGGTPAEFGAMAVFLASAHAKNITGQTLKGNGGWFPS